MYSRPLYDSSRVFISYSYFFIRLFMLVVYPMLTILLSRGSLILCNRWPYITPACFVFNSSIYLSLIASYFAIYYSFPANIVYYIYFS